MLRPVVFMYCGGPEGREGLIWGGIAAGESGYRLRRLEAGTAGHLCVFAAPGILAADIGADVVDPAFPPVLRWNFVEPRTGVSHISGIGSFPHAISDSVVFAFEPLHLF